LNLANKKCCISGQANGMTESPEAVDHTGSKQHL